MFFDKSTYDFFITYYSAWEIDGSAGQTFNPGSLSQIVSPNELLQENEWSDPETQQKFDLFNKARLRFSGLKISIICSKKQY